MVVIQSIFRVVNCKELQPIVQLSQLTINSVNDVEWRPTYYQVEPVVDDVNSDTKTDTEDQVSIISISSEDSLTSLSSTSEVDPFIILLKLSLVTVKYPKVLISTLFIISPFLIFHILSVLLVACNNTLLLCHFAKRV